MDTLVRENFGVGLGDKVRVERVAHTLPIYSATKIILARCTSKFGDYSADKDSSSAEGVAVSDGQKIELENMFLSANLGN